MALSEMNVAASALEGGKTGLDILTAEKSFTVFAKDGAERDMWLRSIGDAVVAAKEAAGVSTDPAALQVAPVLVQTSDSNDCGACVGACMGCGYVACDPCCNPTRPTRPSHTADSHLPAGLHALHAQAPLHVLRPRRLRQVLPEPVRMQSKAHTHTDDPHLSTHTDNQSNTRPTARCCPTSTRRRSSACATPAWPRTTPR